MKKTNETDEKSPLKLVHERKSEPEVIKTTVNKELVAKLENELAELKKEFNEKLFLVKVSPEVAKKIHDFIILKAKWKYSESVGIIQINEELEKAMKQTNQLGFEGLMLSNLTLEAINYFYSTTEGVGLIQAKDFLEQVKPLSEALTEAQKFTEKINTKEFELASAREGISVSE